MGAEGPFEQRGANRPLKAFVAGFALRRLRRARVTTGFGKLRVHTLRWPVIEGGTRSARTQQRADEHIEERCVQWQDANVTEEP